MLNGHTSGTVKVRVELYGRVFYVVKEEATAKARSIQERKLRANGKIRDETYWHHSHRLPMPGRGIRFGRKSLVRDVLTEAGARYDHLLPQPDRIAA